MNRLFDAKFCCSAGSSKIPNPKPISNIPADDNICLLEESGRRNSTKFRRKSAVCRICPLLFSRIRSPCNFLKAYILIFFVLIFGLLYFISIHGRYFLPSVRATSKIEKIQSNNASDTQPPFFKHHNNTAHLDCRRIMDNDVRYMKSIKRVAFKQDPEWPLDCESIKSRNYFPQKPLSRQEGDFPIAFARAVYQDYNFLETELAATYQPQNFYCYAIDAKANETFHRRIKALSSCFPNVYVNQREWPMYWGHNMSFSHLECMKTLTKDAQKWRYLVLQQNYDAATKTNQELVQIYRWMQGANDVQIRHVGGKRIDEHMNWTFEGLRLFRNETRNLISHKGHKPELDFANGYVQSSLSREMVDFILNDLNVTQMVLQLDNASFAVDEIFMQTLQATDAIDAPGGFTHVCLDRGLDTHHWTRFHRWGVNECHSKLQMHYLCVFGVEDLAHYFNRTNYLFLYKMNSEMDFGAIDCWHEVLFNRTHFQRGTHRLNAGAYLNHPTVRFNVEKKKFGFVDIDEFDCVEGNAPNLAR